MWFGLTGFAGGDCGPGGGRASAGAVVGQDGDMVEGAGPQAGHTGAGLQSGCPHTVSGCLPLVLAPVTDLEWEDIWQTDGKNLFSLTGYNSWV